MNTKSRNPKKLPPDKVPEGINIVTSGTFYFYEQRARAILLAGLRYVAASSLKALCRVYQAWISARKRRHLLSRQLMAESK